MASSTGNCSNLIRSVVVAAEAKGWCEVIRFDSSDIDVMDPDVR